MSNFCVALHQRFLCVTVSLVYVCVRGRERGKEEWGMLVCACVFTCGCRCVYVACASMGACRRGFLRLLVMPVTLAWVWLHYRRIPVPVMPRTLCQGVRANGNRLSGVREAFVNGCHRTLQQETRALRVRCGIDAVSGPLDAVIVVCAARAMEFSHVIKSDRCNTTSRSQR